MRITKSQLRSIIREACGLDSEVTRQQDPETLDSHHEPGIPSPDDYDRVRAFLVRNSDIVDLGISMVMDASGSSCERSTAQAIIDHLKSIVNTSHTQERETFQNAPMMTNLETM